MNALFLGTLLYQSRLVPRALPVLGLIGAALIAASDVGVILGLWGQFSTIPALTTFPIAIWEFSLGVYLTVKGFRPSALATLVQGGSRVERVDVDRVEEESRVPGLAIG